MFRSDSTAELIRSHPGRVRLHLAANPERYRADITVSAREAIAFFEHGISVNLEEVDATTPGVSTVLDRLSEEFGVPRKYCFCSAFISAQGSGLPLHFDGKEVVVLQVAGRKRWQVAPNSCITNPVDNYTADGVHTSRQMRRYVADVRPVLAPTVLETVDMVPGSVLYLPRGHWHGTTAEEESISLSFGFAAPSWAAVFVNRLQDALLLSDHWRAPALRRSGEPAEFVPADMGRLMQLTIADLMGGSLNDALRGLVDKRPNKPVSSDAAGEHRSAQPERKEILSKGDVPCPSR
jgi:ribosomal protein L16 Arg81 hydroxylase